MPRDIPIGNGRLLICFDRDYSIRELFYPHVGQENHIFGRFCRLGIWLDQQFSWIGPDWEGQLDYLPDTMVTDVTLSQRFEGDYGAGVDAVTYPFMVIVCPYAESESAALNSQQLCARRYPHPYRGGGLMRNINGRADTEFLWIEQGINQVARSLFHQSNHDWGRQHMDTPTSEVMGSMLLFHDKCCFPNYARF
jgi:hypothetical protein